MVDRTSRYVCSSGQARQNILLQQKFWFLFGPLLLPVLEVIDTLSLTSDWSDFACRHNNNPYDLYFYLPWVGMGCGCRAILIPWSAQPIFDGSFRVSFLFQTFPVDAIITRSAHVCEHSIVEDGLHRLRIRITTRSWNEDFGKMP